MSVLSRPIDLMAVIVAISLDAVGAAAFFITFFGMPFLGEPISSISDIAGGVFFTIWSIAKGGGFASARKKKKMLMKLGLTFIAEAIAEKLKEFEVSGK